MALWAARTMNIPILATTSDPKVAENNLGSSGSTRRARCSAARRLGSYRSGARFTVGYAIDELCALEASFFFLTPDTVNALFSSDRTPVIAAVHDRHLNLPFRELVTSPANPRRCRLRRTGTLKIDMSSSLLGAE